ncbi:MAG: bile acid:sodium symporter [Rhodobacterales bacterium]|nr:MAG: bile acid:sodium symporter [Rhodobacterales bacterium]
MDILINVVLPLSLAVIMFSLGLGLRFADFGRVLTMPRAVGLGLLLQMIGLPLVAFALVTLWKLPPELSFGVMLLSFCPGGVTSNILAKLGGGTVALSITLTAITSLLSVLSVPILCAWAATHFLGESGVSVDTTHIAIAMFVITALPVLLGLLVNQFAHGFASKVEPSVSKLAAALFVIIVIAALAANWGIFTGAIGTVGPLLIVMNLLLLGIGIAVGHLLGLSGADAIAIAVEMGVQNASLGITVAGLIGGVAGIGALGVPAAVYGITMYLVTLPVLALLRARPRAG